MRTPVLDVEPEIDQQKQRDQARPVAERNRDRRQPDLVDESGNDAEDQTAGCRLGDEVADRHADRDAGIFPRIVALPAADQPPLEHCRGEENRKENHHDRVCGLAQQLVEAEVEFHRQFSRGLQRNRRMI
jgi:hypothetical protein